MDRRGKTSERGASVIEFAVVLPVLLILVFGIIEFGLVLFNKSMITNAAREGARVGILYKEPPPRTSEAEIKGAVLNYCTKNAGGVISSLLFNLNGSNAINESNIMVTMIPGGTGTETGYDPSTFTTGDLVKVTVNFPYDFLLFPNLMPLIPGGSSLNNRLVLSSTTQMRAE